MPLIQDGQGHIWNGSERTWKPAFGSMPLDVRDFGAVGDGTVDDTAALNAAFATTGAIIQLPAKTFKTTAALSVPTCAGIVGAGRDVSIIKPSSAVSTFALKLKGATVLLMDFQIDGTNTTGATGAIFGDDTSFTSWGGSVRNVRFCNFTGTNGTGARLADALKASFRGCLFDGNATNLLAQKISTGFPTTVHLISCQFVNATADGVVLVDGHGLIFSGCVFESNAHSGLVLLPASGGVLEAIQVNGCWFEGNYGSDTTKYQLVAGDGTALGGATIIASVRDTYFAVSGSSAKAMRFNGSPIYALVSNPTTAGVSDNIAFENDAKGFIPDWPNTSGMDITTVLKDPNNRVAWGGIAAMRTWTPTESDNTSTGFASITYTTAAFHRMGQRVYVELYISGTLNAGTPNQIDFTAPTNLAPGTTTTVATSIAVGGTLQAGILIADAGSGKLSFRKIDNSNYASGAALVLRGQISYQL